MTHDYWTTIGGKFTSDDAVLYEYWAKVVPNDAVLVECGTFEGRSMGKLLTALADHQKWGVTVFSIDVALLPGLVQRMMNNLQPVITRFHDMRRQALGDDDRDPVFRFLQFDSIRAARLFDPASVWGVFIDTIHTAPAVTANLRAWEDKLTKDGQFGFHDYYAPVWPGVVAAVDHYFAGRQPTCHSGACIAFKNKGSASEQLAARLVGR